MKRRCACGCGEFTPLAKTTRPSVGRVAGSPLPFCRGHRIQSPGDWHKNFWKYVKKTRGCWLWMSSKNKNGYGVFGVNQREVKFRTSAHRVAYEICVGPIPPGYTIDHKKCRNPGCVNPAHLEAVPHSVNLLRGNTVNAINAAKTHCVNGHKFTKANTYIRRDARHKNGARVCKTCAAIRTKRIQQQRRR